ncbi:MAG: bifunctional acetate--CoA ligase family protein/GNAT family N-acetyltransferase [Pseudomonadota bacterium]
MSTRHLNELFNPKSIAVIGASETPESVGASIMKNLVSGGFKGMVYPVNPRRETILGLPAYPHIQAVGKPVDMAVIATPIASVPGVVDDCGKAGVKGAVILSSGGKETGKAGRDMETAIGVQAKKTGMRIVGPNCLGMVNTAINLNATFAHQSPLPGKVAFLSQSGAVCTSILDLSLGENVGFSHFVSLGSMMDVDFADMIDFLGSQKSVESIVMYVESLTNIRNFMSAARAVSRIKPIIALKAGRSPAGARAAASHTGAMAGEDAVYDAAFKRAGILRVGEFQDLFDCAEFLAKHNRPRRNRLAIITNAGGPGVMAADALASHGLEPADLSKPTLEKLNNLLPDNWSKGNPVDILGDSSPETYCQATRICMEDPAVDGLLLICSPAGIFDSTLLAEPLTRMLPGSDKPVFTSWIGGQNIGRARALFNAAGIITYDTPERAVRAFVNLYTYGRNVDMLHEIPIRKDRSLVIDRDRARSLIRKKMADGPGNLTEIEAKTLLGTYGIPVNPTELAETAEQAQALAASMGFPVSLKIASPDILHKSDSGGILLNLTSKDAVEAGFRDLITRAGKAFPHAKILGVSVQPMLPPPDLELILGMTQDRDFGPVLLFGMGGVLTEVIKDVAMALPPLNHALARRAIETTRISKVLGGFRNIKPVDMTLLEEIMIRLSRLVTDFPEIQELDINPLQVHRGGITAVDARVVLRETAVKAPMHLVISSYPWIHEAQGSTTEGIPFLIRPIRPEDAQLMIDHFSSLSPRSIYLRFFLPMKQLSNQMLVRFTQIDYDREVALIALMDQEGKKAMAGVARVIFEADGESGEFSVIVQDQWHGKGIGASLLKRCLIIAKDMGLKQVWGLVLSENTQMIKLGRKLGFAASYIPGSSEVELKIDLSTLDSTAMI